MSAPKSAVIFADQLPRGLTEPMGKEPCKCLIYKDPKSSPEETYTRVGKKKPK